MTRKPVVDVRVDDLAFFEGDAIVRPVTSRLGAITPLMRRLELAAGPRMQAQLAVQEPLAVGSAVVTGAGALAAELMIHAVVQSETEPVTTDGVRRAIRSAFQRMTDWQLAVVAMTPLGVGAGNLDVEESAQALADVLAARGPAPFPTTLTVVTETEAEAEIFRTYLSYRGL